MAKERQRAPESTTAVTGEGIKIKFASPELLRAYIWDPQKWLGASLAERIAGIREIPLGEFSVDGQLFESVKFTLVIEPDRDIRGQRPTCIIRADLKLGLTDSAISRFQADKSSSKIKSLDERERWENNPFRRILEPIANLLPDEEGIAGVEYSSNVARIFESPLKREAFEKIPLVVLQLWDKDVGIGQISVSLTSFMRYTEAWEERGKAYQVKVADGWETDQDEQDRWQFGLKPVGIDVYDAEKFKASISFYEQAFSIILKGIYQAEDVHVPGITWQIESPHVLKETERITFADIGGQKEAVTFLRAIAQAEQSGLVTSQAKKSVLLCGPPGNGKTTLAYALAVELKAPIVVKTTKDLSSVAQDSEIRNFFEAAFLETKSAARRTGGKAVCCFEGIEAFLGKDLRLHDFFLNAMDEWVKDTEVVVIATSNFPDQLHPGILSRFERIAVVQPNEKGRLEILQIWAAKLVKLLGKTDLFEAVDLNQLAERLEDASGRDIKNFLIRAYQLGQLRSQEAGYWVPQDNKFLIDLISQLMPRRIGFRGHA